MDYCLLLALLIDLIIGDPSFIIHPVVIIGKVISSIERGLRKKLKGRKGERLAGIILVIVVVGVVYITTFYIIRLAFCINTYLGIAINLWLLSTTIAARGLVRAGLKVYRNLLAGDIQKARRSVGEIVGRDTEQMNEIEIIRATVETIAENTSDGIQAPIFFYIIGGTPLAMTYKAINTLDSMIGHLNRRYKYFGWAAARLDDLVNYLPARITALIFNLTSLILPGYNAKKSWRIMWRDARKHPSLNAGYPEAAIAGALGVQLGGLNYYQGKAEYRATLGDEERGLTVEDIKSMIKLCVNGTVLFALCAFILLIFV
jgi:adenosylcobinamide-phosphate synthase